MGVKVRKKAEKLVPKGEVRELLNSDPYGGRAYLATQLRRVFTPVESSVVLN